MEGRWALVTGGAGFIGSHLVERLLEEGWRVRVLDNLSVGKREHLPPQAEFFYGDVLDREAVQRCCEGIDTVFHLAARVTIRRSVETFVEDARTNILGTLTLLQAAGEAHVRRFILASSMAVYADAPRKTPVGEDHPTEPISPYGIGKLAAERYVLQMGPVLGLEPVVLRFFNTFGPRQGFTPYVGVVTIFTEKILRGEACTIFGDGRQCRDFVDVEDVAWACRLAADAPHAVGEAINIGSGRGTTVLDLAELLRQRLGGGTFVHAPPHPVELRYSVAKIEKARRLLGYVPRYHLAERIDGVIADIRQRVKRDALLG